MSQRKLICKHTWEMRQTSNIALSAVVARRLSPHNHCFSSCRQIFEKARVLEPEVCGLPPAECPQSWREKGRTLLKQKLICLLLVPRLKRCTLTMVMFRKDVVAELKGALERANVSEMN